MEDTLQQETKLEDIKSEPFTSLEPLTEEEKEGIILAARSAFLKLHNLYQHILPIFDAYGFKPPSAGVIARDLAEKIEISIIQHNRTFSKGFGHNDLGRFNKKWEVKICKNSGLTINQSVQIGGENYIVVNYKENSTISKIWVLWAAQDNFFSPIRKNSNSRGLQLSTAQPHIEIIYENKAVKAE